MRNKFLSILILCLINTCIWAASVELQIDETSPTVGEEISLKVIVSGSRQAGFPQMPTVPGLFIESRGSSSQFQIINGQTSISKTFEYSLEAKKEGEYSLGPVRVEVGGQKLKSNIVKLKVSKSNGKTAIETKKYFYVDVDISNENPYLNEQIIYTFKLHRRVNLQNASVDLPEFDDFWKEDLVEEKTTRKMINGVAWTITEIKYALFPQKAGNLKIPATKFSGYFLVQDQNSRRRRGGFGMFDEGFFSSSFGKRKKASTTSKELTINVKELPTFDGPENISGLVGDFSLSASTDQKTLKVGESLTLKVDLKGKGNIFDANIKLPDSTNFKSYDDEPIFKKGSSEAYFSGVKTFKKALVPLKPGQTSIPEISVVVFSPKENSYKTIKTNPISLSVSPGDDSENNINLTQSSQTTKLEKVKTLGKDLTNIKMTTSFFGKRLSIGWLSYLLIFSPFLLNLFFFLGSRRNNFRKNNKDIFRQRDALKNFEKSMGKSNDENFKSFKNLIGDLLLVDGGALTGKEVMSKLMERKVSTDLLDQMKNIFEKNEMMQFAGAGSVNEKEFFRSLKSLAQKLTKELK